MEDIIFITIASVVCGAETWNEIEVYGESKESWLREHLLLPNDISSHATFIFFNALNPTSFEEVGTCCIFIIAIKFIVYYIRFQQPKLVYQML